MKKIFLLLVIVFIFLNLFAVSAQENETLISMNTDVSIDTVSVADETPAISIETSISNDTIYIGNQTEATVTVKNVGNCNINNLSIINIQSFGDVSYNDGFVADLSEHMPYTIDTLQLNDFEPINGSWNYAYVNDNNDTLYKQFGNYIYINLTEPLETDQSYSFKVIYNTTKKDFYNYANLYFFMFSNDTMINNTCNQISVSQIPRTVYVNRELENDSLIVNAEISSLDNSIFSGPLSIKVVNDVLPPNHGPNEVFEKAEINFTNNTGSTTLELPLNKTMEYTTGLIYGTIPKTNVYSYNFVYNIFDESQIMYPKPSSATVEINATPAVSIETSISNSSIYIGNSTEVTVTVKNVGNCDINDLSIFNLLSFDPIYYTDNGFWGLSLIDGVNKLPLHFSNFESINGTWNYVLMNDSEDFTYKAFGTYAIFNLTDTLKVNQSCSFKVIYNTTKKDFYNYERIYFFTFSNNTLLNNTYNEIKVSQIPRTVYITREIQNGSLIVRAKVSSLDNSIFSGELDIKVAENHYSPAFPKQVFDEVHIKFANNTGNTSIKLPLTVHREYATGLIPVGPESYSAYAYEYVYNDSFNEWSVQNRPEIKTSDLVKVYKNNTPFTAKPEFILDCDKITFEVNGVTYVRKVNETGFATLNINLSPGVYTIVSSYDTEDYYPITYRTTNKITVLPTLIADNLVKYYMNDSQFDIKLVDSNNNPVASQNVTFNINGVFYSRQTNDEGIARLNINLEPGEYVLTATDPLTGLNMSYNITVLPVLYAEDVISHYGDSYDYCVKLVDNMGNALSGKSVSFNINGMIFNNITDAKGEARLFINLMPGKYIITAQYLSAKISNDIIILEK